MYGHDPPDGPSMRPMWNALKRRWKYLTAKLSGRWEENADPKVQLEQAMAEAQEQHRRLVEQAASVIANQKQTELQLNRSMQELERTNNSTRQALSMANDAAKRGDTAKATEYNQTAEAFANRLIVTEKRVEDLKNMHLQATQAAQQAKAAVQQNANLLQGKLAERQKLLSQLDQARMQEQLNSAMRPFPRQSARTSRLSTRSARRSRLSTPKRSVPPSCRARGSTPACSRSSRPASPLRLSSAWIRCAARWACRRVTSWLRRPWALLLSRSPPRHAAPACAQHRSSSSAMPKVRWPTQKRSPSLLRRRR